MEEKRKTQSLISGAMLLMISTVLVHLINIFFKIPITNIIGEIGRGYFTSAYEIYTPIYAISMAGLPVALSKMVSERIATGKFNEVRLIKNIARNIFIITGTIGTILLIALAKPFSDYVIGSPNTFYSILCIAPSIFICCLMSTYRGYYQGLRNMGPTSYSQVFEVIGKLVFGVLLAKLVVNYGVSQFEETGIVFGRACTNYNEIIRACAPYSSAAAITGVTIGSLVSLIYLVILFKVKGDGIKVEELYTSPEPDSKKSLRHDLIAIMIPIATGSLVLNITNFIDSITIQSRLITAISLGEETIREIYPEIGILGIATEDIKDFLYGCYGVGLDFRNLIPAVIMSLGVSAIPVLAASYSTNDVAKMEDAIHTVVKTSTLLSVPTGFCMAALATPILKILYPTSQSLGISSKFVFVFGIIAFLISICTPINNMLQAIGRADVPMKTMILAAAVKIALNYFLVGLPSINIYGALIGTVAFYVICIVINSIVLIRETKVKIKWVDSLVKPSVVGVLSGLAAYGCNALITPKLTALNEKISINISLFSCAISLIFAIVVWAVLLGLFKVLTKNDVLSLPKGQKIAKVLEKLRILG